MRNPCRSSVIRKDAFFEWAIEAVSLLLLSGVQLIEPLDKEQIGDLIHHLERVGDAARPERIPDAINLTFSFSCNHCSIVFTTANRKSCMILIINKTNLSNVQCLRRAAHRC